MMKVINNVVKIPNAQQASDLKVFHHHIYEYQKGLRNMVLTTEKSQYQSYIENRLKYLMEK